MASNNNRRNNMSEYWRRLAQSMVGLNPEQVAEKLAEALTPAQEVVFEEEAQMITSEEVKEETMDFKSMLDGASRLAGQAADRAYTPPAADSYGYPKQLGKPEFVFTVGRKLSGDDDDAAYALPCKGVLRRTATRGIMGKVPIMYRNGKLLDTRHESEGGMGFLMVGYLPDIVAEELYNMLEAGEATPGQVQLHMWNVTPYMRDGSAWQSTFDGKESFRADFTLDGNYTYAIVIRGTTHWITTRDEETAFATDEYKYRPVEERPKSTLQKIREDFLKRARSGGGVQENGSAVEPDSDDDTQDIGF